MKKLILGALVILSSMIFATYPSVPRVFGPGNIIPIGYLNENFNYLTNASSSGSYDANFLNLYINNSLFVDSAKNIQLNNLNINGYINAGGNLTSSGNLISYGAMTIYGSSTVNGSMYISTLNTNYLPSTTIGTLNVSNETVSTLTVTNLTVTNLTVTNLTVTTISATTRYIDKTGYVTPVGSITAFGGSTPPLGWLTCDGSSVLIASYPDLYASISGNWGTADGSHFNLPDLRGYFLRGLDTTKTRDADWATRTSSYVGGNVSSNVGSVESDQYASHAHTFTNTGGQGGSNVGLQSNGSASAGQVASASSGGSETRPKNVYVLYIIKY